MATAEVLFVLMAALCEVVHSMSSVVPLVQFWVKGPFLLPVFHFCYQNSCSITSLFSQIRMQFYKTQTLSRNYKLHSDYDKMKVSSQTINIITSSKVCMIRTWILLYTLKSSDTHRNALKESDFRHVQVKMKYRKLPYV